MRPPSPPSVERPPQRLFRSPTAVSSVVELDEGPRLLAPIDESDDALEIGERISTEPTEYDADYDRG